MDWGQEAADRLADIATRASLPGPGVTRLPFTAEHRAAVDIITGWMNAAGLDTHMDAAGTLVGRKDGPPGAPVLLLGSHQDSVPGGGAFDGIMGVALACLALEALRGTELAVAVEVLAFADEEGVRFPTALMGPRALAGTLDPAILTMRDAEGTTLADALEAFGGRTDGLTGLARSREGIAGFIELHIEQGPVLERLGAPLGLVTAICGIERHAMRFSGSTGHAGTVPMEGRQDALVAAAGFVADVPRIAAGWEGLRATVGTFRVRPGAPNAIPDWVDLVLELRSERDADRAGAIATLTQAARDAATRHGCTLEAERSYAQPAVTCDPALSRRIREAAGRDLPALPSGATHDASAMADLCPIAMLFLRCRGGISHRPDEFASPADMGAAVDVLAKTLAGFGSPPRA
jgi:allantoate deiminase